MHQASRRKRACVYSGVAVLTVAGVALGLWASITHTPSFYRTLVDRPKGGQEEEAKSFVKQSLQLRNDIANEPTWEAVFTDTEVNAWLAEDLVKHFADQLPPEVHEPRIAFEAGRITLAFQLDQGPVRSVIWVVARARIPEDNVVALTLEKIRAGALPVPPDRIVHTLTEQARKNGLEITWSKDGDLPVATIRYRGNRRDDVVLERVHIRDGQIRLNGRSNRQTASAPTLPSRQSLQDNFPSRKTQNVIEPPPAPEADGIPGPIPPAEDRNSATPSS